MLVMHCFVIAKVDWLVAYWPKNSRVYLYEEMVNAKSNNIFLHLNIVCGLLYLS